MKIIVTGGAGFIGSHVVDAYLAQGHKVIVVDNLSSGKKESVNPKAKFYQVDIRDTKKINSIFQQCKPDVVNHQAAQKSVRDSVANPQYDAQVNILGILNLLTAAAEQKVKKFVFASSGGVVYGETNRIPTPEDHPKQPTSPYGITKYCSELYLEYWQKQFNLPFVALRYANVYGPGQDPFGEAGVVAIFIQRILDSQPPIINGDGQQTRDYVFVGDVARANLLATRTKFIGALNIGTGKETSVNQLFKLITELMSVNISPKHCPARPGEQQRSALAYQRVKEILGWGPKISLKEGLKLTIQSFKSRSSYA